MRAMRLVVMFDLPTGSKRERKTYAEFRKFLIGDGYNMEQFSVYTRVSLGRDNMDAHVERLKANLPAAGRVTLFCLTEKQYEDRSVLVCSDDYKPAAQDLGAQLTLFF